MADAPRGFGEQLFQRLQGKGLSRAQIYKALALQRVTEEVMELGAQGKLQEGHLVEISKINSAARQKQLAEITVSCQLDPTWSKELARIIRNAEKTTSDKEANKYWDFFFEAKDILERDGTSDELLHRVRTFSIGKVESSDPGDRTVVEFKKYELQNGRGLDVGTSNIVASAKTTDEKTLFNIQRNAFIDVRNDTYVKKMLMKLGIDHIIQGDKGYVIGDPAFELANIFEKNTRRPMKDGMISPLEMEALTIVGLIIGQLLGPPRQPGELCSFSVPADPIDVERNVVYHRGALESVLRKLGYEPKAMVEGHCVVMGEMESDDYTGVGISCGAGMFNVCVAYKSVPALAFSTSRGGDWIDNNVAAALGLPSSMVCSVKESGVDLSRPRDRVEDAIVIYYRELIRYSLETIRARFESSQNMPSFPDPVPLVCAGGTSMVKGFVDVFREEFRKINFPIDVKEIRLAHDPLRTVARGCVVDALVETKARTKLAEDEQVNIGRAEISKVTSFDKGTRRLMRSEVPASTYVPRSEAATVQPAKPLPPPKEASRETRSIPRPAPAPVARDTRSIPRPATPPQPAPGSRETRSIPRTAPSSVQPARPLPASTEPAPSVNVPRSAPARIEPAKPLPEQRRSEQQVVVRPAVKLPTPDPEPEPEPEPASSNGDDLEIADFGSESDSTPEPAPRAPAPRAPAPRAPAPPPKKNEEPEDFPLIS